MSLCCLPASERLVRFRQGWVHHLLVHAGVGGQLDDVAVRIAEIYRSAEAVVDRSAYFHGAFPPFVEHVLEDVVVDGECYVQVEAVLLLEFERLVRGLEKGEAEPSFIWKNVCSASPPWISKALTKGNPRNSSYQARVSSESRQR